MSHRLKQKIKNSKVYEANWLSLAHNNDSSHQKIWSQKVQEGKHIQEQKQIDRILIGIVKQKLFGQLLAQDTRISVEGYYNLDRMNKQLINPIKNKNIRKISPLKNQPLYQLGARSRIKHKTIDNSDVRKTSKSILSSRDFQMQQLRYQAKKNSRNSNEMAKTKKLFYVQKLFTVGKIPNLANHFRQLASNQTAMMYDVKLSKEMLVKYNKQNPIISQRCLDRFLFFYNFSGPLNYKQFCAWIESAANCTNNEASFFVFQLLDQSAKGYINLSDLFRVLQDFPFTTSSLLQKQIFQLQKVITEITNTSLINERPRIKQAVEELIIKNPSLKIQEMKELIKQSSKQLINTNSIKTTTYHQSMYALEHNPSVREKKSQLQYSDHNQKLQREISNKSSKPEGLKFTQFAHKFAEKRSQFFILTLKLFIGEDLSLIQ